MFLLCSAKADWLEVVFFSRVFLMQVLKLRKHIETVSSKEPYMGEHMPLKWLRFEKAMSEAVEKGTNYLSLDKVRLLPPTPLHTLYMREHMPLKWLRFEKAMSEAVDKGTDYLSLDKVRILPPTPPPTHSVHGGTYATEMAEV